MSFIRKPSLRKVWFDFMLIKLWKKLLDNIPFQSARTAGLPDSQFKHGSVAIGNHFVAAL